MYFFLACWKTIMGPFFAVLLFGFTIKSWSSLESLLPTAPVPVFYDASEIPQAIKESQPIFFRDREALNPYCQQVWLALEAKGVEYVTVLSTEDDGVTKVADCNLPRIEWPDGTSQKGSLDILERIQKEYQELQPDLYERISVSVDNVRSNIIRFDGVFPRSTNMEDVLNVLKAPFIYEKDGKLTSKVNQVVAIEGVDECLEEYDDGPFLCGDFVSAADFVWGPFLERMGAQLPLAFDGKSAEPRSDLYPALVEWYEAMEENLPYYTCRVGGDKVSWENVFKTAVVSGELPTIDLLPPRGKRIPVNRAKVKRDMLWAEYVRDKPYVCNTPEKECAAFLIRNRDMLSEEASKSAMLSNMNSDEFDAPFREFISLLIEEGNVDFNKVSANARDVAAFLDAWIRTPRDFGMLPAASLRLLVTRLRGE